MRIGKAVRVIEKYVSDGNYRFLIRAGLGKYNSIPDGAYLSRKFQATMGYALQLDVPRTFNEKLQWLKMHDRNPAYTVMVDKHKVRDYIAEKIGAQYLIPLLGVWDAPDEIDFDALPDRFVLKCNHNSGLGMYICKDKSKLTAGQIAAIRRNLKKGLAQDYYLTGREWPYKDVPRKIIAEQFMKSDAGGLTDYKVHCFGGEPRLILVCKDRFTQTGLTEDFFTPGWEHLDLRRPTHPNAAAAIARPAELAEMLTLAKTLSASIPFLRVDFYIIEHKVYFSELTFFPASGFEKFVPEEWDRTLGDWLCLPAKDT